MIKKRLELFINENKLLPYRSYAYQKGKSAAMCINDVINVIASRKKNRLCVVLAVVDLSNAYNCVNLNFLNMENDRFPKAFIDWILSFLSNRVLKLGAAIQVAKCGVPQGSCLSPILFNIYTKRLLQINDENSQIMQFSDDFMIITSGRAVSRTVDNLQNKLKDFNLLCKDLGFSFNPSKSVVINVGRGCKKVANIAVENVTVPNQRSVTFLGRIISANMPHKEHVKNIEADTIVR